MAVHRHAQHHLRLVRPAVPRVAALEQVGLLITPDERARCVDEHQVELVGEHIPVALEQIPLEVLSDRAQEVSDRAVHVVQCDLVEARALDCAHPA